MNSLTPHRRVCLSLLLFVILLTVCGALARLFALSVPYVDIALCSLLPAGSVLALYVWRKKPDVKAFFRLTPISRGRRPCGSFLVSVQTVPARLSTFRSTCSGAILLTPRRASPHRRALANTCSAYFGAAAVPALCEDCSAAGWCCANMRIMVGGLP